MIIETAYKQGDIVSVKLASGEEVVGRFDSAANGGITLIKPMMLVAHKILIPLSDNMVLQILTPRGNQEPQVLPEILPMITKKTSKGPPIVCKEIFY